MQIYKGSSIFKKILVNNLVIMLVPITIILSIVCYLICLGYKSEEKQKLQIVVNKYAEDINSEMEKSLQMSENILKNTNIINGLNKIYLTPYDNLEFFMYIKEYINNMTNNNIGEAAIYSPNTTLFDNSYMYKAECLANYEELIYLLRTGNMNVVWDNTIITDERGNQYFNYYRSFPFNAESILACKVYFPQKPDDGIIIAQDKGSAVKDAYVSSDLNNIYTIMMKLDKKAIHTRYLLYILIFIGIDLFLVFSIILISHKVTYSLTYGIDAFITQLGEKDILSSDINLLSGSGDSKELRILKNTIGSLVVKVKEISASYYETELEKRRIELNLLQSKLGPHILYNSLSVIKLNAFQRKDSHSMQIINNLSSYYRALLNYGKETTEIEQELELIRKYVDIYTLAHKKTYNLSIDVSDEIKGKQVLHLILQPFVENSIVHGLSGKRENCEISISCVSDGGYLIFSLKDNGYGIPEDKLIKLNDLENYDERYGIKNTYQRLKLVYGEDSEITFASQLDKGTCVTIKFKENMNGK